ncbi:MAG: hypothetical protein IKU60_00270 [Clostridia bacterium]|nr:hypothetical protein [Clostridia bacterium]
MDNLKLFLKENKVKKENVYYGASNSLKDDNGEALKWEIRHINTNEDEKIREDCIREGKKGVRVDYNLYLKKLAVASVVFPPLYNASLQDSYGVHSAEDLLCELIDNPGEYQEFLKFIQKINGFDVGLKEKVDEAKN